MEQVRRARPAALDLSLAPRSQTQFPCGFSPCVTSLFPRSDAVSQGRPLDALTQEPSEFLLGLGERRRCLCLDGLSEEEGARAVEEDAGVGAQAAFEPGWDLAGQVP